MDRLAAQVAGLLLSFTAIGLAQPLPHDHISAFLTRHALNRAPQWHALPVLTQAVVFITVVRVDATQMATLIAACIVGGWLGAGIVARLSRRALQIGLGCALLAAAAFMLCGMLGLFPAGGTDLAFTAPAFVIALAVNFLLGALLTLGIGNYAPSLIVFSLLGIDPRAAFPIMMGSGAFVATVAGLRFIGAGRFDSRAGLGLTLGGIPGVVAAVWLVKSLPLAPLRWMVLVVVVYAAIALLHAGLRRPPVQGVMTRTA